MYRHVFAARAFIIPSLPSSAFQIALELYKAGTQSRGSLSKFLLSSISSGVGGCLKNVPIIFFRQTYGIIPAYFMHVHLTSI